MIRSSDLRKFGFAKKVHESATYSFIHRFFCWNFILSIDPRVQSECCIVSRGISVFATWFLTRMSPWKRRRSLGEIALQWVYSSLGGYWVSAIAYVLMWQTVDSSEMGSGLSSCETKEKRGFGEVVYSYACEWIAHRWLSWILWWIVVGFCVLQDWRSERANERE